MLAIRPLLRSRLPLLVNSGIAVALLAGAGWAYLLMTPSSSAAGTGDARTVTVQRGAVIATVTATGAVESATTAAASFVTGGTVTSIAVKPGQRVAKGQVLAKVDPAPTQRDQTAAQADVTAAQHALDRAQDAESDTSATQDALEQAEAALADAKAAVAGTVLKAPMAGTVTAVNGALGTTVGAGSGSASGGANAGVEATGTGGFIDLADLTKLQVRADFGEADATTVKAGQAATITWNALSGVTADGTVGAVDAGATTSSTGGTVTYAATIGLTKAPTGAKPGQTVTVVVETGSAEDALNVPAAALTGSGARRTATVLVNGAQQTRAVRVGLVGARVVEVTSGLDEGDQVVLPTASTGTNQGGFPGGGFPGGGPGGGGFPGGGGPGGGGRTGRTGP